MLYSFFCENSSCFIQAKLVNTTLCFPVGKTLITSAPPSQNSTAPSTPSTVSMQSPVAIPVTVVSFTAPSPATISLASVSSATATAPPSTSASTTPTLKKQRPLLPRETVPVVQRAVVWNPTAKFQTSSQKWHMQKVQRQQQNQQPAATTQVQASSPRQGQAQVATQSQAAANGSAAVSSPSAQQSSQNTRYQTRQAVKGKKKKRSFIISKRDLSLRDWAHVQIPSCKSD